MTIDLVLKLLERFNNEVESWGFAKDHHGHVAIVFSQSCEILGIGDQPNPDNSGRVRLR